MPTGRIAGAETSLTLARCSCWAARERSRLPSATRPWPLPRASRGAGPPRLVLVREPDQLGVERFHPQLAFGVRLVELAEANRHVAADDDRTPARLDDDHLQARV
jgi:hypothetical protein